MRAVLICAVSMLATGALAQAQTGVREIETIALNMPNLGAQPRLKSRTTIGCCCQSASDYRCIVIGLRMQGAVVIARTVNAETEEYLDRHCRGERNGLDYTECRFQLAFDYVSESFNVSENMRVYRAENMELASDYLSGGRRRPAR